MNKKEPTKYSMSTGLPDTERDQEVKKYPLKSIEQEFYDIIWKHKEHKADLDKKDK